MNENEIAGGLQSGFGRAEGALGEALGAPDLQLKGAANRASGGARKVAGKVQATIDTAVDRLSGGVATVGDRTRAAYARTAETAHDVADRLDPLVTERKYAAIGLGVAVGVALGLLIASRPKVIYVKPRV